MSLWIICFGLWKQWSHFSAGIQTNWTRLRSFLFFLKLRNVKCIVPLLHPRWCVNILQPPEIKENHFLASSLSCHSGQAHLRQSSSWRVLSVEVQDVSTFLSLFFAWDGLSLHLSICTAQEVVWTLRWKSERIQTTDACSRLFAGAASKMQQPDNCNLLSNAKKNKKKKQHTHTQITGILILLLKSSFYFLQNIHVMIFLFWEITEERKKLSTCLTVFIHGCYNFPHVPPHTVSCWAEGHLHQA